MPQAPPAPLSPGPSAQEGDSARAQRLLAALVEGSTLLLARDDFDAAVVEALGMVARAAGARGAALVRHADDPGARCEVAYEWRDAGLAPDAAEGSEGSGRPVAGGPVRDADAAELADARARAGEEVPGARCRVTAAISVDGRPWGALRLDGCRTDRPRGPGEEAALAAAARAFGGAVHRQRGREEATRRERQRDRERRAAAEARAAELSRANDAMRRSVDRLAGQGQVDALLEGILLEAMRAAGAAGGGITLWADDRFRAHACIAQDGAVVPREEWEREAIFRETAAVLNADQGTFASQLKGQPFTLTRVDEADAWWPAAAAYHRSRGHVEVWNVPCVRDGELLAHLGLAFREPRGRDPALLGTLASLAQQVTLALELTRLAGGARDAAVAREREAAAERRAAELERLNDVLRSSLARLSGDPDVDAFLGHVVGEIVRHTGAANAMVTRALPGGERFVLHLFHDGAAMRWGPSGDELPLFAEPFGASVSPAFGIMRRERRMFIASAHEGPVPIEEFALPGGLEWMTRIGASDAAVTALFAGDEVVGTLHLHFTGGRVLRRDDGGFLHAMSQHAAVALRLAALAGGAREAAVARERERAAEERAEQLARAGNTLARTAHRLATEPDLDAFLRQTLVEIAAQMRSTTAAVTPYDPDTDTLRAGAVVVDGAEVPLDPIVPSIPRAEARFLDRLLAGDAYVVFDVERDAALFWPGAAEFLRGRGMRKAVAIPIRLGDLLLGQVSVAYDELPVFSPEQTTLVRALGNQAALAIQLSRLAQAAREAAVARERERAAEERAAELSRANEALQRTVGRLSEAAEVRDFYSVALAEMARALSAGSAGLMLFDARRGSFRMTCHVAAGAEQPLAGGPHEREWSLDDPVIARAWEAIQRAHPLLVAEVEGPYVHPDTRGWHRAMGDAAVVFLPLFRGPKPLGFASFGVGTAEQATRVQRELASALGQQLALALELERLAGEARTAAVARERRQAAEARAAELARANAALRTSLDALAAAPDAQLFLAQVLHVAAEQFSAPAAVLWAHGPGRTVAPRLVFADGRGYTAGEFAARYPECPSFRPCVVPPVEVNGEDVLARRRHFLIADIHAHDAFRATAGETGMRWYRERGARQELNLPLRLGDATVGALAVYLPDGPPPSDEQVELGYALAAQATLALELTRLAEVARDAAVAQERERVAHERARELARSNEVLRAGLDRLAGERDPAAFFRHVLAAMTEAVGGRGAALFRYDPATHRIAMELAANPVLPSTTPVEDPAPFAAHADVTPYWRTLVAGRAPLVLDAEDPAHAHLFWPGTREWHRANGQPLSVGVPLLLEDEPLGFIGLTLPERATVTSGQLGLVQALAHQAALALHMTRLAEETREAAVARERERAAEERAAELARANRALRRSVASVATLRDIDAFLVEVLRNATAVAGAASGAVVLGTGDDASLQMHSFVRDGRALDPATDPLLAPWRAPRPLHRRGAELLRRLLGGGIGWAEASDPTLTGEIRAWHRALGHARVAHVPLFRGSEAIGFLALGFGAGTHPPAERLEMVRVLAQQAELALELSRLGGEAEQAAVAEERNRIAREIHDTLARGFSGIIWTLEGVKQGVATSPDEVAARVDTALELARGSLAQARHSLWALRPGTLPHADLHRELRRLAASADGGDTRVELGAADEVASLSADAQANLLRIAEEAVNNALRHAAARTVRIELTRAGGVVTLRVADDGKGFGPEAFAQGGSFGVRGMRERAHRAGGQLEIDSVIGRGTTVTARVPDGAG